jgi:hypothetical protein
LQSWTTSGNTTGGSVFTVTGRNFGAPNASATGLAITIGRTDGDYAPGLLPCTDAAHDGAYGLTAGQRRLTCTLPEGAGSRLNVWVQVADLVGNATAAFSYNAPTIDYVQLGDGPVLPSPSFVPSASSAPTVDASFTPSSSASASATTVGTPSSTMSPVSETPSPSSTPPTLPSGLRRLQATESATPSFAAEPSTTPSNAATATPSATVQPSVSVESAIQRPLPDARLGGVASIGGLPSTGLAGPPTAQSRVAVTVIGANFGRRVNGSTCLFFAWYGRTDRSLVCDGRNTYVGEGEVPYVAVTNWDHDRITFLLPPGAGLREIVPFVSGQVPAATLVAAYAPPDITSELVPRLGSTDGGDPIAIAGTNFGLAPLRVESREERDLFLNQPLPSSVDGWVASDGLRLPQEILRVNFARLCFSRYNDSQGFRPPVLFPCGNAVLTHEPNAITLRGPPGIGVNRSVSVTIMDRLPGGGYVEFTSRAVNFSYLPPEVTTVQPRPVPMDGVNTRLITLQGNNFGRIEGSGDAWTAEELAVRVVVGRDTECRDAIRFEDVRSGAIMLRCALGNTPVGSKNLTYTVAGQSGFNDAQAGIATVFAACEGSSPSVFMPAKTPAGPGAYGRDGEMCYPCPTGAFCGGFLEGVTRDAQSLRDNGVHAYPRPLEWWFNLNSSDIQNDRRLNASDSSNAVPDALCPPLAKSRYLDKEASLAAGTNVYRDVCIVPCEPKEACIGDNYCAIQYKSIAPYYRCATCADGYYKRATECIKCPDSPAMLFVGAAFLLVIGAAGAYILNKKKINIGYISIGIDFFQVLAMFGNSKVKWPAAIRELFHILSAFNLNIEIVAPECLMPNLAFRDKWIFIMVLPIGIMAVFLCVHGYYTFYKGQIKGRKQGLTSHTGACPSAHVQHGGWCCRC